MGAAGVQYFTARGPLKSQRLGQHREGLTLPLGDPRDSRSRGFLRVMSAPWPGHGQLWVTALNSSQLASSHSQSDL